MGKLEFSPLGPEKNRSAHSSAASTAALAPVHVVLVGGDLLFRAGLKRLFENSALKLTAEADSLADLEATASLQTQPQVLIAVDPEWPDTNSEVWREQFQRLWPDAHLIALITGNDEKAAAAALRNGLDGCLFADMAPPVLVHAIQLVAMGANVFPTRVGRNFVQNAVQSNRPDLTPRERDILQRLQAGYSNKMIANSLGTTDMTVKAQLRHLLRKLGVTNRTQAALWAREQGMDRPQRQADQAGAVALPGGDH